MRVQTLTRERTILMVKSGQTRTSPVVDILKATQQRTEPCTDMVQMPIGVY